MTVRVSPPVHASRAIRRTGVALLCTLPLLQPPEASPQAAPGGWVGCWSLTDQEPWAPTMNRPGWPSGTDAPAPRLLLLDRIASPRRNLAGAPGAPTWRAEWAGTSLLGLEAWAVQPGGNVYLESSPGVRVVLLLLEGPPTEGVVPARWFFRRDDTPFPEIRSLATARRVPCPDGRAPHTEVELQEAASLLESRGVEATFVHYDAAARRITRVNPGMDRGLVVEEGRPRTTAWSQVVRTIEGAPPPPSQPQGAADPERGTGWTLGVTPGAGDDGPLLRAWAFHIHRAPSSVLADETTLEGLLEALLALIPDG